VNESERMNQVKGGKKTTFQIISPKVPEFQEYSLGLSATSVRPSFPLFDKIYI